MKSILVIETPKDCYECPCYYEERNKCEATFKNVEDDDIEKPSWCPLRPLPKWKIDGCSAFNEDGGIVYDDEVFDWVKELIE